MSTAINVGFNRPIFQASWPQSLSPGHEPLLEKVKAAFLRALVFCLKLIFFPFTIPIKNAIYPSSLITFLNESDRREYKEILKSQYGGESVSLRTPEGHKIDGMFFRGNEKKTIIYCVGWKSYFEFKKRFEMIHEIKGLVGDINLMMFNPRGVGESEGDASADGAALDLYSVFKYLTEVEQIDPSDIVIYGHSLGAIYGTLGAKLIQEEYPEAKINLLSERSFGDYEENVRHLVLDRLSGCPRLAIVLAEAVAGAIRLCRWEGQTEGIVSSLRGRVCVIYDKKDEAVCFIASFYKKLKERVSQDPPREYPIRCIKLFEPEEIPSYGYSPHTRYLNPWEKFEIVNELKRMFGLEFEEPMNIRRVKDMGVERPVELRGLDKDFYVSLHAVNRLYAFLQQTEAVTKSMLEGTSMMFSVLETESLLLRHFREQEAALRRTEDNPLLIDVSPQGVKAFYLSVLARTRTMLILEQLEKSVRENQGVQEIDRHLLQMLEEGMLISFERPFVNRLFNPATWLYAETYQVHQRYRRNGMAWPALGGLAEGRPALRGEIVFPNSVRLEALLNLKNMLLN